MTQRKILFVDDEEKVLSGLRRMLRQYRREWDMHFASSGEEALSLLALHDFDLVVSDVRMPGMDGISLLSKVNEEHPDIVRIILSGYSEKTDTLRSTNVAHQYLAKPCDADMIRDTVTKSANLRAELASPELAAAVAGTQRLPSAPVLYASLTEELQSDDPSLQRVARIVQQDPAMAAKILQVVNSAFFGLRREVTDVDQAVTLLGMDTIVALVLTTHLFADGGVIPPVRGLVEAVQNRSLAVAQTAKAIAVAEGMSQAECAEVFLAGVLYDAGKLVYAVNWPEQLLEVGMDAPLTTEASSFGADHGAVGSYLLTLWGLPDAITAAVAFHHQPSRAGARSFSAITAVHAAHVLETGGTGFDGVHLAEADLADRVPKWQSVYEDVLYERENP